MKKVFIYSSPAKEQKRNGKTKNYSTTDKCSIENRKKLFRQPLSCPHFSFHVTEDDSGEEDWKYRRKPGPQCTDLLDLIENKVKKFRKNEFIYLSYAVPEKSVFFHPYCFKQVKYSELDKLNYRTLSRHGFASWGNGDNLIVSLDEFIDDYKKYLLLTKKRTFSDYRLWKPFKIWRKTVRWRKFSSTRQFLSENLFLVIPHLTSAILLFRKEFLEIEKIKLLDLSQKNVWNLPHFLEKQMAAADDGEMKLQNFINHIRKNLYKTCAAAINSRGFNAEDENGSSESKQTKELLSFADRVVKRRFCKLLSRYLRYMDYLTITLLHSITFKTFVDFLETIEEHYKFCPDAEKVVSKSITDRNSFSNIKIELSASEIRLIPTQTETVTVITDLLERFQEITKNVHRFESDLCFKCFTEPVIMGRNEGRLIGNPLDIEYHFCVDNRLMKNRSRLISVINETFEKIEIYCERFETYRELFTIDLTTNPEDLTNLLEVSELEEYCLRYTEQLKRLSEIEKFVDFGIFQLDQGCFEEVMTPIYKKLYDKICSRIPNLISVQITRADDQCQEIMGNLLTPPEGTSAYVHYLQYLENCENILNEMGIDLENVDSMLSLVEKYEISIDEDLKPKFVAVNDFLRNCHEALKKKQNQRDVLISKLSNCIIRDLSKIIEEVTEVREEVLKEWILSEESQPGMVKETISASIEQLNTCFTSLQKLSVNQEIFGLNLVNYDEFNAALHEAKIRQSLWENLEGWTNALQDWYTQNFYLLDIDAMKEVNEKVLLNCEEFEKHLPDNTIAPKLKTSVILFRNKLRIICHLRNTSLKMRHWLKIEEIINRRVYEDESITIKDFEEVGTFEEEIAEKLTEISRQACFEKNLEEQLSEIEKFWSSYELKLENYRHYRNNFILIDLDPLEMHLDDSFVNVSLISSSDHVNPIKDKVDDWLQRLQLCSTTIEEWKMCQDCYCKLEVIFTLPGIRFKMPEELELFKMVNKSWRKNMEEVDAAPHAISVLTKPGRLEEIQENNKLLSEIQEMMGRYLNTRRLFFPRLFFLSDNELLHFLTTQPKYSKIIESHLPSLFHSISKLEMEEMNLEALLEPLHKVTHLISNNGIELKLTDGIETRGSNDQWLRNVEMEMMSTIKQEIDYKLQCFNDDTILNWLDDTTPQVILTVYRLKQYEEIVNISENTEDKMKWFEKHSDMVEKVKEFIRTVLENLCKKRSNILSSLLLSMIYHQNLIYNICNNNDTEETLSNCWHYDIKNKSLNFSIGDLHFPYQYEFIAKENDFILSQTSDKMMFNIVQTLKACHNGLLLGPEGAGKRSTVKMLACLIAKFVIIFDCSQENKTYDDFRRILNGIIQSGTWAIFNQFDKLDNKIMSVIGHQIHLIKNAKLSALKEINLSGDIMKLNKNAEIFFMSNCWETTQYKIPDSFKMFLRPISFDLPDYEHLIDILSISEGLLIEKDEVLKQVQMSERKMDLIKDLFHRDPKNIEVTQFLNDNQCKRNINQLLSYYKETSTNKGIYNMRSFSEKSLELIEKLDMNDLVIISGPPGSGKTKLWKSILQYLNETDKDQSNITSQVYFINSLSTQKVLGHKSDLHKYEIGLLMSVLNKCINDLSNKFWIILDGKLQSQCILPLLKLSKEDRFITFPNLDRIKITENIKFIIETDSQEDETRSCFTESTTVKLIKDDIDEIKIFKYLMINSFDSLNVDLLSNLFDFYYKRSLDFVSNFDKGILFEQNTDHKIKMLTSFLKISFSDYNDYKHIEKCFIFSTLWSIGMNFDYDKKEEVEFFVRNLIEEKNLIPTGSLWNYFVDRKTKDWKDFMEIIPEYKFSQTSNLDDHLIPNLESTRMLYMIGELSRENNILLVGPSGIGKSDLIRTILKYNTDDSLGTKLLSWCAKTTSKDTQDIIVNSLKKRRKSLLGPEIKKRVLFCIENFDAPVEDYSNTDTDLLRQLIDINGIYDYKLWEFQDIIDVSFLGVCDQIDSSMDRIKEKCIILSTVESKSEYLKSILIPWIDEIAKICNPNLTPALKSFIKFLINLTEWFDRELPKQISFHNIKRMMIGILRINTLSTYSQGYQLTKLLFHECQRHFMDRLVVNQERNKIKSYLEKQFLEEFQENFSSADEMIYGDFVLKNQAKNDRAYEEIKDLEKLKIVLSDYLEDFNLTFGRKWKLFWHEETMLQLTRIAGMIRLPQFHAIIVGPPGIGKKTLAKLATFLNDYHVFEIRFSLEKEVIRETLKDCLKYIIFNLKPVNLLVWDIQNVDLLIEIHDILCNGWSPTLFTKEELRDLPTDKINNINQHFHVTMLLYSEEEYENLCKKFPSVKKYFSVNQFQYWTAETLQWIAAEVFKDCFPDDEITIKNLSIVSSQIHQSLMEFESNSKSNLNTINITKYLHLMALYQKLWKSQKEKLETDLKHISTALEKVLEIIQTITTMKADLKKYLPLLEHQKSNIKEMKMKLETNLVLADDIRSKVTKDEAAAKIQTAETQEYADEAAKDLEIAMPALRAAQDTIKALSKSDMSELKGLATPSKLVMFVMEAVCILFNLKPDWPTAKNLINDPGFIKKIIDFEKEYIPEAIIRKIKTYIEHKDFDPAKIEKVSKVCKSLCLWIRAIDQFSKVYKVVEPKVKKQQNAENALREVMILLRAKQQELADAEGKIQILKDTIEEKNSEFKVLQENVDLINLRLSRANRLITALADEEINWGKTVDQLNQKIKSLPSEMLLSASMIVYLGEYSHDIRTSFIKSWIEKCLGLNLVTGSNFDLSATLLDELVINRWRSLGLPKDNISIENGIIITKSLKWILVIDPIKKFLNWILNLEPKLTKIHYRDKNFEDRLEDAVINGRSLIVESVVSPINEFLVDILRRNIFTYQGKKMIRTTKKDIIFHPDFKVYLTTYMDRSEFPIEVLNCINLVKFKASSVGLEEIFLHEASKVELQVLEAQTKDVESRIESDSLRMKELQEKILQLLFEFSGNILDNEELVASLVETKETYSIVVDRLADSRESENVLIAIREKYRPLAILGSNLFQIIWRLKRVNLLYSFELSYVIKIFCEKIVKVESENVSYSIQIGKVKQMEANVIDQIFTTISQSLREEDQINFGNEILSINEGKVLLSMFDVEKSQTLSDLKDVLSNLTPQTPLIIIPFEDSLSKLLNDFDNMCKNSYYPISIGIGNEDYAIEILEIAISEGKIFLVFNCSFSIRFVKYLEERFLEIMELQNNFRLVIVGNSYSEIPKSLLRKSFKMVYKKD